MLITVNQETLQLFCLKCVFTRILVWLLTKSYLKSILFAESNGPAGNDEYRQDDDKKDGSWTYCHQSLEDEANVEL